MKKTRKRHTSLSQPLVQSILRVMAERPDRDFSPSTLQDMLWVMEISACDSTIGRRLRDLADMGYVSKRREYDSKGRFYRTYRITKKGCRICLLLK